jgi:tRNA-dihydrouridine synthase C
MTQGRHPFLAPLPLAAGRALPNRILPGPMEGVTGGAFCAVLSRAGYVRCWVTPFLRLTTGVPRAVRLREHLDAFLGTGLPVLAQVMGTNIELLCGAAVRLAALGVAGIDLNCACPSRTVLANGAGGARLRHPEWIHAALRALRLAVPGCGVSVKLRSGLADPAEMADILPAVAAAAPTFVTLHFRTAAESYAPVRGGWQRLARARTLLPGVVLVGCGDVCTAAAALRLQAETGVDGVAAARGLLRNPRLLLDIEDACAGRAPPAPTRQQALARLCDMAQTALAGGLTRPGFVLEVARHMLGESDALFQDVSRCRSLRQVAERLAAEVPVVATGRAHRSAGES